jgi:hypothetical protein
MSFIAAATAIGSTLAAAAPYAGAAATVYGALKGGGGGGGQTGYDLITPQQRPYDEANQNQLYSYGSDMLNRSKQGLAPAYFENSVYDLRKMMSDPLYRTYYGSPGQRTGTVQNAFNMGAMTGLGPKASMAQGQKAMYDYSQQESAIDQYLAALKMQSMQNQETTGLSTLQGLPSNYATPQQASYANADPENPWMSLAGKLPWEDLLGGLGSASGSFTNSFGTFSPQTKISQYSTGYNPYMKQGNYVNTR